MGTGNKREMLALWIGPGARLAELRPFLAAALALDAPVLGVAEGADIPRGNREHNDLAIGAGDLAVDAGDLSRLADLSTNAAIVLVDADELGVADCADLERFLARSDASRVLLVGEDPARRGVRALLRTERARWIPWPPDVEDLRAIADLRTENGASRRGAIAIERSDPSRTRIRSHSSPAADIHPDRRAGDIGNVGARAANNLMREIEEIERVLGADSADDDAPLARASFESDLPAEDATKIVARSTPNHAGAAPASDAESAGSRTADATAFRAQVADLADIAQRIELSLEGARAEPHAESNGEATPLESVAREVARLVQFARTLGYLVAPPARGAQRFDLTEMLEVFLSEIRSSGSDAPRCLLRSNGPLPVLSDRRLLSQAFDALFFLARSASTRGEILRVQALRDDDASPPAARVTIDFPTGELADLAPAEIVSPYGVRRVFPELGPNALSAAARIIEGQGGRCRLEPQHRTRLEWRVSLPLAPEPDSASGDRSELVAEARGRSPGASSESDAPTTAAPWRGRNDAFA
jgi:hypothetical protein